MKPCAFAGAHKMAPASTFSEIEQGERGGRLRTLWAEKPGSPIPFYSLAQHLNPKKQQQERARASNIQCARPSRLSRS